MSERDKKLVNDTRQIMRVIRRAILGKRLISCEWAAINAKKPIRFEVKIVFQAKE